MSTIHRILFYGIIIPRKDPDRLYPIFQRIVSMKLFIVIAFILFSTRASSQVADSVLMLKEAKVHFLQKNFYLLAAYYEIAQAEAQLVQARLWYNPTFIWNQEAYSNEQNKFLRTGNQFEAQINQTISIAGKHTNTVKLAKVNVELNRVQFQNVVRSLLFELERTYNDLAAFEKKETLYAEVLASYERLIAASEKELQVGAISVTEDLRIKSEYITVKADALDNANQKEQSLSQLRTLLQFPKDTLIVVEQRLPVFNPTLQLDTLIARSLDIRPDLRVARYFQIYQERNVKLQRSLSIPDVSLGYDYDKAGNYIRNYNGVVLQIPLPVFDRNQGRIQEAQSNLKQSGYQLEYLKITVANQVIVAFNQYKKISDGLIVYSDDYLKKLDQLNRNTNIYFQRRDISLLQFIDQQRIYITTNLQLIGLRQQYLNSISNLNFSVGEIIIDY